MSLAVGPLLKLLLMVRRMDRFDCHGYRVRDLPDVTMGGEENMTQVGYFL